MCQACRIAWEYFHLQQDCLYDVKAKRIKSTGTPLLILGGQNVKSVNWYKYLGIVLDTELLVMKPPSNESVK